MSRVESQSCEFWYGIRGIYRLIYMVIKRCSEVSRLQSALYYAEQRILNAMNRIIIVTQHLAAAKPSAQFNSFPQHLARGHTFNLPRDGGLQ